MARSQELTEQAVENYSSAEESAGLLLHSNRAERRQGTLWQLDDSRLKDVRVSEFVDECRSNIEAENKYIRKKIKQLKVELEENRIRRKNLDEKEMELANAMRELKIENMRLKESQSRSGRSGSIEKSNSFNVSRAEAQSIVNEEIRRYYRERELRQDATGSEGQRTSSEVHNRRQESTDDSSSSSSSSKSSSSSYSGEGTTRRKKRKGKVLKKGDRSSQRCYDHSESDETDEGHRPRLFYGSRPDKKVDIDFIDKSEPAVITATKDQLSKTHSVELSTGTNSNVSAGTSLHVTAEHRGSSDSLQREQRQVLESLDNILGTFKGIPRDANITSPEATASESISGDEKKLEKHRERARLRQKRRRANKALKRRELMFKSRCFYST